jgi:hypothetical protein
MLGVSAYQMETTAKGIDDKINTINRDDMSIYPLAIKSIARAASLVTIVAGAVNERENIYQNSRATDIHLKGAEAKNKNLKLKMNEAISLFEDGEYHTYSQCALEIYERLGLKSPRTIEKWLSSHFKNKRLKHHTSS